MTSRAVKMTPLLAACISVVGLILVCVGLFTYWRVASDALHARSTGNPVYAEVKEVQDRSLRDILVIDFEQAGKAVRASVNVPDQNAYREGQKIVIYVTPSGDIATADGSSNSGYAPTVALDVTLGGSILVLIAVVRLLWETLRRRRSRE
jgi:hypothetical protein